MRILKSNKKVLSTLLALVMLFSLFPATISSADEEPIELNKTEVTMLLGGALDKLEVLNAPEGATVTWSSTDLRSVRVSPNGYIVSVGKSKDPVTVRATVSGGGLAAPVVLSCVVTIVTEDLLITNDVFHLDSNGDAIFAQAGSIYKYNDGTGKYWWYGTSFPNTRAYYASLQTGKGTIGGGSGGTQIRAYSSTNLVDWDFEGIVATGGQSGWPTGWLARLGVVYNEKNDNYVMMGQGGGSNRLFFATSDTPNGPFTYRGTHPDLRTLGVPSVGTGDMTVFYDDKTGEAFVVFDNDGMSVPGFSWAGTPPVSSPVNTLGGANQNFWETLPERDQAYIGVLNEDFTGIIEAIKVYDAKDDEFYHLKREGGREANSLFRYGEWYYKAASGLRGWNTSPTFYMGGAKHPTDLTYVNEVGLPNNMSPMRGSISSLSHTSQVVGFVTTTTDNGITTPQAPFGEMVLHFGDRWANQVGNGLGYDQFAPISFVDASTLSPMTKEEEPNVPKPQNYPPDLDNPDPGRRNHAEWADLESFYPFFPDGYPFVDGDGNPEWKRPEWPVPVYNNLTQFYYDVANGTWSVGPNNNYLDNSYFENDRLAGGRWMSVDGVPMTVTVIQQYVHVPNGWNVEHLAGQTAQINWGGGGNGRGNAALNQAYMLLNPELPQGTNGGQTWYSAHAGNYTWYHGYSKRNVGTEPYDTRTYQAPSDLPDGLYTFYGWFRSSGGQEECYMYAGDQKLDLNMPIGQWTLMAIEDVKVKGGTLEVGFHSKAEADQWLYIDDVALIRTDDLPPDPVTRTVTGTGTNTQWIVTNGLFTVTIQAGNGTSATTKNGAITAVRLGNDPANFFNASYPSVIDAHITALASPTMRIIEENDDILHIVMDFPYQEATYTQAHKIRFQRHYVFVPGITGFYDWMIMDTPVQKGGVAEARTLYGINATALGMNKGYSGEFDRAFVSASGGSLPTWGAGLGSVRSGFNATNWMNAGPRDYYTKYDLPGYYSETNAVGIYGNGRGAWMIYPSTEFYSGGPYKQEMLFEPTILENYVTGGHSGGQKLNPPEGWSKIYGPWMVYFNHLPGAASDDEVRDDALRQAAAEEAKWPFDFVTVDTHPNPDITSAIYPKAHERATVTGKIEASGGQSLAGAMVVLSEPGVSDLVRIVNDYYFYSYADENGNFTINNVRPGDYSLFIVPQSGALTGQYKSEALTIAGGGTQSIGTHTWITEPHVNYLFQIGSADRRSTGFGGTMNEQGEIDRSIYYQMHAPASLTFDVNTNVTKDWYYTQPFKAAYSTASFINSGIPMGVWNIKFDSTKTYGGTATVHFGFAGVTNQPIYKISVNGTVVETLYFGGIQDQAFYRQFSRGGRYIDRSVTFDAGLLVEGENLITIENISFEGAQALFNGGTVIYDVIYLTTDEAGNADSLKQLINNGIGAGEITDGAKTALFALLDGGADLTAFLAALDANGVGKDFKELLTFSARNILAEGATVNKAALIELIAEAEGRGPAGYGANGWAVFTGALNGAKVINGNEAATQAEINAAIAMLRAALDNATLRAPAIPGFVAFDYDDFEYSTYYNPWGFVNLTTSMYAAMAGDVPVRGNNTRKIDVYTNGGTVTTARKTLAEPVDTDVMLVTFDYLLGAHFTGSNTATYDIRFLDGNGLPLVGVAKTWNLPLAAYAQFNRTGTNAAGYTNARVKQAGSAFTDNYEWYNVVAVIDKVSAKITFTFTVLSGANEGAAETLVFDYDPALTDGKISAVHILSGNGTAGNAYFDNFGIYVNEPTSIRIAQGSQLAAPMIPIGRNSTIAFNVLLYPTGAMSNGITWSVNNPNLASVDQNGVVTTKGMSGNVTVTARDASGVTHSVILRVT